MDYFIELAGNPNAYKYALHGGVIAYLSIRFMFVTNSTFGLLVEGKTSLAEAAKTVGLMFISIILLVWFLLFQVN
ncbi:hypothetical protein THIAE_06170 [Thiomicrospira aerophila AL3]|uniref:Uncharacterized protein n=1 Tax=Thiomicrospira aerophila AL3 TaxID=717772 RepID=W0DZ90_9GAMM|nr:hypothetical protein [Thiomicrospira aerophila]AHF02299.1 hypothetical protein THIAE_06170 [Thiomicrospira aerophila AL3]